MNQYISDNISEAKNYLNNVEMMGIPALHVAERIIDSNKLFIHKPELQKEIKTTIDGIRQDYDDARNDALKQNETIPESYEKHVNLANYLAALEYEKVQKLINFWDKINGRL